MPSVDDLRAEIAQVRPLARAEAAFRAAADKSAHNPWAGSAVRLAALERELEQAELRAEGEALVVAMDALAAIGEEEQRANEVARAASAELAALERHPTVTRWKAAPEHAKAHRVPQHWEQYAAWFISLRGPRERGPNEYAPQTWPVGVRGQQPFVWPEPLRFDEIRDREVVRAWLQARDHTQRTGREAQGVASKRVSILAQYPVLCGIEPPKRERSAA